MNVNCWMTKMRKKLAIPSGFVYSICNSPVKMEVRSLACQSVPYLFTNVDMDFILKVPKEVKKDDSATVTYIPLFSGLNTEFAQNLPSDFPEYLQEEIEFDRSMTSLFYCRLSNYMKSSTV